MPRDKKVSLVKLVLEILDFKHILEVLNAHSKSETVKMVAVKKSRNLSCST